MDTEAQETQVFFITLRNVLEVHITKAYAFLMNWNHFKGSKEIRNHVPRTVYQSSIDPLGDHIVPHRSTLSNNNVFCTCL